MNKKKLYICITPFFPSPDSWRGAYVYDQVKAIERNSDYKVLVFKPGQGADYEVDGIKVYGYKTLSFPSNILNGFFNGYNARSFVRRVKELAVDIKNVAVVHCHVCMNAACGLALKRLNPNITVLLQHHDLDPLNLRNGIILRNSRLNVRYRARKAIRLYNQVDLHICISEPCKENLVSFPKINEWEVYTDYIRALNLCKGLPCVTPKDVYVLNNGVDTHLFNNNIIISEEVGTSEYFRIGCISNFQELKDQITLIKAFEIFAKNVAIDNIRLSLLGTGETRAMCEAYIRDQQLEKYVEWPKEMSHDKLPEYYRSLNLFVLPSYFEGFGCVYTEAAASGVPFIGVYGQGAAEIIEPGEKEKWLIPPRDYRRLSKLMTDFYYKRYEQKLCKPYDIDVLITDFLRKLDTIR